MKKSIKLFSIILFMFLFISNINATSLGEFDETVNQEGEYNSVRFIGGNNVQNKATIDGISFGFGNNITTNGHVTYGVYLGNDISVNEFIEKDLFVAGNNINIGSEAILSRDVFAAGNIIGIYTNVGRDLRAAGSYVSLKGITVGADAYIDAEKIVLDENTTITGKLSYPENANITGLDVAKVGSVVVKEVIEDDIEESIDAYSRYMFVTWLIAAIVTTLIILALFPKLRERLNKANLEFGEIGKTSLIGLGVLFVVPIISLFTIFTVLLTPLTLIVLAIYAVGLYLSKLFASYIVGNIIMKQFKLKNDRYVLSILVGVVLTRLLSLIPVLGSIVQFMLLIYGLGLIYTMFTTNNKKK